MIEKALFVKAIKDLNICTETYNKLLKIYDAYIAIQFDSNYTLKPQFIDRVLETLFKGELKDYTIPIDFINSPVGHVLFTVRFNCLEENFYSPIEVALIVSKTKALISHDIKMEKLTCSRNGKNIIISEKNLLPYMISKGFSEAEAKKRISTFLKLKHKNLKFSEIKKQINFEK